MDVVFVEKILRVQPNVKKLYLLLRAADSKSALQRLNHEIIAKDLFRVLREKWGTNLYSHISQKVTPVAGDITRDNLGVDDCDLLNEMTEKVNVVVNLAATTNFDERARKYGWPNTYVFTKAMGEMLLGDLNKNMPLAILRPTIITSTYKEPFPGWVEGIRTVDSMLVGFGKGKLTCFLGDPDSVIDCIPADMVVNAMIAAIVANANQPREIIYHVGSSVSNAVKYSSIQDYGQRYFTKNPWVDKDGKPVKVGKLTVMTSMDSFRRYMTLRYLLPLKAFKVVNTTLCQFFEGTYMDLNQKIKYIMRLVELYEPYLFFKGIHDDMNTEKLRMATREGGSETDIFYFDPKYEWIICDVTRRRASVLARKRITSLPKKVGTLDDMPVRVSVRSGR
ncbi:hypothetical protein LguiB_031512 [Lonicera macranthoides]